MPFDPDSPDRHRGRPPRAQAAPVVRCLEWEWVEHGRLVWLCKRKGAGKLGTLGGVLCYPDGTWTAVEGLGEGERVLGRGLTQEAAREALEAILRERSRALVAEAAKAAPTAADAYMQAIHGRKKE